MKNFPHYLFIFILLNIGSVVILFSPAKGWVQSHFISQNQKLLSVIEGDLKNDGTFIKVVKLQTNKGIVLEFYSPVQYNGSRSLINRVEMLNVKNGFFNHRGEAVQLAIVDLDGDGKMELLSPTFNTNMLAQLNPYFYSSEKESFIPFNFTTLAAQ